MMTRREIEHAAQMALRAEDRELSAAERFAAAMWLEERGLCIHRGGPGTLSFNGMTLDYKGVVMMHKRREEDDADG